MRKILTFKPWLLFVLIFVCGAWTSVSPLKELVNSVAVITFSIWIYAIGVYGQERIEELGLKPMNLNLFKANVFVMAGFCLIGFYNSAGDDSSRSGYASGTPGSADILYMLASLYFVFAAIQTIVFAAKTIAKIEFRQEVRSSDYFMNIILFLLIIAGVWILQPKVARLIGGEEEEVNNESDQ